jgi:hypothetical protein
MSITCKERINGRVISGKPVVRDENCPIFPTEF